MSKNSILDLTSALVVTIAPLASVVIPSPNEDQEPVAQNTSRYFNYVSANNCCCESSFMKDNPVHIQAVHVLLVL